MKTEIPSSQTKTKMKLIIEPKKHPLLGEVHIAELPNTQEEFQKYWDTQGTRLLTKTPTGHRPPTTEERIFDAFKAGAASVKA